MVRKPELHSYQIVLDYLHLQPQQTIFLDDNIDNIKAAAELGIETIWVNSKEQMTQELIEKLEGDIVSEAI